MMPHQKLKVIYKSLNDCLYKGPLFLEDLCGLLLRFRCKRYGVSADIEKAFLQVGLQENDRDVTRFLWMKSIEGTVHDNNIEEYRFKSVPFGIISSPYLLVATIKHHLNKYESQSARRIERSMYVDNIITGFLNENDLEDFYKETKKIFSDTSMNVRQWTSNSTNLQANVSGQDKINEVNVGVLGMKWNVSEDTLSIRHLRTSGFIV